MAVPSLLNWAVALPEIALACMGSVILVLGVFLQRGKKEITSS